MDIVIEDGVLKKATGKQDVFVTPNNVKHIAKGAIGSDFLVDTFVIGDSVSEIEFGAFYFSNVRKVVFPESYLPTKIINGKPWNTTVFCRCRKLEEVVLLKTIGEHDTFFYCCYPQKVYVYEETLSLLTERVLKQLFPLQSDNLYRGKAVISVTSSYTPDVCIFSRETNKELIHLFYKYDLPGVEPTIEYLY